MVPPRRAAHDGARLERLGRARGRACSSTARGSPRRGRRASGSRTTPSCCSSTRRPTTARSRLPSRRFGDAWTFVLEHGRPGPPAGGRAAHVARRDHADVALVHAPAPRGVTWRRSAPPTACSSATELTFAGARALVPYLRDLGVSHLYLSPSFAAREGSTHGYDVVDPTRFSDALGGEAGFRALAAAAREAGLGIVLDIVPNHMAADDANPYWADPERRRRVLRPRPRRRAATGASSRSTTSRACARRIRRCSPRRTRLALALVREGVVDGLRIDHPDGLADPAGYLRAPARRRRGARVGGEDPRSRRAPAAVAGRGHGRLRVPRRRRGAVRGPGRRGARSPRCGRSWRATRGRSASGRPRPSASRCAAPFAPDVEWLRRLHPAPGLEEALTALPVYRTYLRAGRAAAEEDLAVLREAGPGGLPRRRARRRSSRASSRPRRP